MSRVAVVTGGTRGIGAAIALAFHDQGMKVAAVYGGNDAAAESFRKETGIAVFRWDVGEAEACAEGLRRVEETLGPVDILVNNAGIARDAFLQKMAPEMWDDVINVDLNSLYYMSRPVIEGMRARQFGRIINIASINGQKGQLGQTNYSAAKAGVIGFTKALALETARKGITVNAIAPGYIDTEMLAKVPERVMETIVAGIPVGRLGTVEEIARCASFLAADDAGFITGSTLTINGGQYMG